MSKRIGKFKGITKRESALSLVDGGNVGGTLTVAGASTFTGKVTASGGVLDQNVAVNSSTSAIDITSVAADYKLILTGTGAAVIKVPLATAANAGMVIDIFWAADGATDGSQKIQVENAGSTVITGGVVVHSTTADKFDSAGIHATVNNTKSLEFDADANDHCGGKEGTRVTLYYAKVNSIVAIVKGITTGNNPALDANIASATGWS